jgi:hypothetical protein
MSDHLGDTNKMVSGNPRMDASAHDDGAIWQTGCQLERELNAASVEIERLTAKVAQLYEGAEEQKQRIKRLEEAGDAMVSHAKALGMGGTGLVQRWNKAKEDKL